MWKSVLVAVALLGAVAGNANAATLTGVSVSIRLESINGLTGVATDFGTRTVLVDGGGEDGNFFTTQLFDFDAGANGNEFTVRSTQSFSAITSPANLVRWTLSGLNFTDGSILTGFTGLGPFGDFTTEIGPTSLVITYQDRPIPTGIYFRGIFETSSDIVSTVPVPAALPLLTTALAGIGFLSWRRQRA